VVELKVGAIIITTKKNVKMAASEAKCSLDRIVENMLCFM
jgi:hypothetical protein